MVSFMLLRAKLAAVPMMVRLQAARPGLRPCDGVALHKNAASAAGQREYARDNGYVHRHCSSSLFSVGDG